MSVINRMLQDIDRRQAAADLAAAATHPDIQRVKPGVEAAAPAIGLGWKFALLVGSVALVLWAVGLWRAPSPISPTLPTAPSVAAQAAPLPSSTPAQAGPPGPAVAMDSATAVLVAAPPPAPEQAPSEAAVSPVVVAKTASEKLKMSMQLSMLVAESPVVRPPTRTAVPLALVAAPLTAAGTTTVANVPVRQVATDETIAAARALWADGARVDAVATLREALAAAESVRNQRTTAPLARELARLEVADNRAQNALDLLLRLESLFTDDAEAWALRGNAEQRLALHAEATQSYLAALRLRPSEGRWMLGAAISLAAAGQLDEARGWVERARERDAVTPAIASYLQQLGISARR